MIRSLLMVIYPPIYIEQKHPELFEGGESKYDTDNMSFHFIF